MANESYSKPFYDIVLNTIINHRTYPHFTKYNIDNTDPPISLKNTLVDAEGNVFLDSNGNRFIVMGQ